jgi:hypothetical protein
MGSGGSEHELRSGATADRPDITAARERLVPKARRKLNQVKKCVDALGSIDQEVVAIAPATLPRVNQFDGAGFGEAVQSGRPRLLVLTTESFWVVETRGLLGGGVHGREIKLARIQDNVRINQYRRKSEFGRKTRLLGFDHLRGSQLETEAFDLNSDELLTEFAEQFNSQLDTYRSKQAQQAEQKGVSTTFRGSV